MKIEEFVCEKRDSSVQEIIKLFIRWEVSARRILGAKKRIDYAIHNSIKLKE